jgi:predicted ATP-grasp superfamily ATP-dependent carboligase
VDGTYKFIELNARLWQQHPLAAASGVDFPWLQYLELSGKPVPQMMQTKEGVRWLSLWEDLFAARILVRTGKLNVREWLRSVTAVRTHNLWSPNDMHPPLGQYRDYIGSMLRKRWN